jgi:hypothetical protein
MSGRILKHFDFDERPLGNYETMPMGWRPAGGPGYPRFSEPAFDPAIGHAAPPSLRMDLAGGNIGAIYIDKSIDVHPDSGYQVSAWLKTSGLEHAHAFITAFYLDHAMHEIQQSISQSILVSKSAWLQVIITMPGGFAGARWDADRAGWVGPTIILNEDTKQTEAETNL